MTVLGMPAGPLALVGDPVVERRVASDAGQPWLVAMARALAHQLLGDQPDRLRRSAVVAETAGDLRAIIDADQRDSLLAAAWLHDVGHVPALRETESPALDAAMYLRRNHWPSRVAALVGHHSGARFVAHASGVSRRLDQFEFLDDDLDDALTFADQTVGPSGTRVAVGDRIEDSNRRHGPQSPSVRCAQFRVPYLLAAVDRVEARFAAQDAFLTAPHRRRG